MIKNEKQYKITQKLLSDWEENCRMLLSSKPGKSPNWVYKEQLYSAKQEIAQLKKQLKEYEQTKAGKLKLPDLALVEDIPQLLVQWRIVRKLTQRQLAERLHLHESQIQRYENTNYSGASLATILEVAKALQQQDVRKSA